jgi:HEAT repeat protein
LVLAARDADKQIRELVLDLLCSVPQLTGRSIPALTAALKDAEKPGSSLTTADVTSQFRHPWGRQQVRSSAVQALSLVGRDAIPALVPLLASGDDRLRQEVIFCLAELPGSEAALVAGLKDAHARIRVCSAWTLVRKGVRTPAVLAVLDTTIRSEDKELRFDAVCGWSDVGPPAIPRLMGLMMHWDDRVVDSARDALDRICSAAVDQGDSPERHAWRSQVIKERCKEGWEALRTAFRWLTTRERNAR